MLVLLKRNNKELKNDEGGLITSDEFLEALKLSRDLYIEEKFIPLNLSLYEIMVQFVLVRTTWLENRIFEYHRI